MGKVNTFEDLEVWQKASDIAVDAYGITSTGRLSKDYGLKDQFQRAGISISNNIAEGFEYDNNKDFIKFLRFAKGSTGEVRNLLIFFKRISYITENDFEMMFDRVIILSKQLGSFIKYLKEYESKKKSPKRES
jgi:four helix bundle protein